MPVTERGASAALRGYRLDPAALVDLHELRYQWFDTSARAARPPLAAGADQLRGQWQQPVAARGLARGHGQPLAALLSATRQRRTCRRRQRAPARARRRPPSRALLAATVNFADRSDADWAPPPELQSATLPTHYSVVFASAPLRQATEFDGLFSGQLDCPSTSADVDLTLALYERLPDGTYLKLFDPAVEFRASHVRDPAHRQLLKTGARQQLKFRSDRLLSRSFASRQPLGSGAECQQAPRSGAQLRQRQGRRRGVDLRPMPAQDPLVRQQLHRCAGGVAGAIARQTPTLPHDLTAPRGLGIRLS